MIGHIEFPCSCGRTLRVPEDKAGDRVCCWNCRAPVEVPRPRIGARVARALLDHARVVLGAESFLLILSGSLGLAAVMAIPRVGSILAVTVLTAAGVRFLATFRKAWGHDKNDEEPPSSILREVAGALLGGLLLIAPLVVRSSWSGGPRVSGPIEGLLIASLTLACWVAAPLATLATAAIDRSGPMPPRAALVVSARHPVLLGLTLLTPLAVLVLVEVTLYLLARQQGWFGFLVEDLLPSPRTLPPGLEGYGMPTPIFNECPDPRYYNHSYREALARGYTLLGCLISSLPLGIGTRLDPRGMAVRRDVYLFVRLAFSTVGVAALGVAFAVQARWLGLLASVEIRRRSDDRPIGPDAVVP